MSTSWTESPSISERIIDEVTADPNRKRRIEAVMDTLDAVITEAADELYEALLDGSEDPMRKLAAGMMSRNCVESVVGNTLSRKAGERGPIFPGETA